MPLQRNLNGSRTYSIVVDDDGFDSISRVGRPQGESTSHLIAMEVRSIAVILLTNPWQESSILIPRIPGWGRRQLLLNNSYL
jgi:hypothetical protein